MELSKASGALVDVQRRHASVDLSPVSPAAILRAAMPLGFVRSALFGVQERCKAELSRELLASDETLGVTLGYSGPRLNRQHARLWQALLSLASVGPKNAGSLLTSAPEVLRVMGTHDHKTSTKAWLMEKLSELGRAQVTMKTRRVEYFGQLVTEVFHDRPTGQLRVSFNPRLAELFVDEYVETNLSRKSVYGRNQLAMWLHDFLSSQHNSAERQIPFAMSRIQQLCGSQVQPKEFRRQLEEAAELLATRGVPPLLLKWAIDAHHVFSYEKTPTKVTLLPKGAHARIGAESRAEVAAQAARQRRAGLVL